MATISTDTLVTKELLKNANISLRDALRHHSKIQLTMKRFNVRYITTMERIIDKLDISLSSLFKISTWDNTGLVLTTEGTYYKDRNRCITKQHQTLYLSEKSDSLVWDDIYTELFKRYYKEFYKAFTYEKVIENVDDNTQIHDLLNKDYKRLSTMSVKEFRSFLKKKVKTKFETLIKTYANLAYDSNNQFYLGIPQTNHSIYLTYEDLLKARNGDFEGAWKDITERVWYVYANVKKQGETEWFNCPLAEQLKQVLYNMSVRK